MKHACRVRLGEKRLSDIDRSRLRRRGRGLGCQGRARGHGSRWIHVLLPKRSEFQVSRHMFRVRVRGAWGLGFSSKG